MLAVELCEECRKGCNTAKFGDSLASQLQPLYSPDDPHISVYISVWLFSFRYYVVKLRSQASGPEWRWDGAAWWQSQWWVPVSPLLGSSHCILPLKLHRGRILSSLLACLPVILVLTTINVFHSAILYPSGPDMDQQCQAVSHKCNPHRLCGQYQLRATKG